MERIMEKYGYALGIKNLEDVIRSGGLILSTNMRNTAIERLVDKYAANLGGEPREEEQVSAYTDNLLSMDDETLIYEYVDRGLL